MQLAKAATLVNDLAFHVSFAVGLRRLIALSIAFRITQLRTSPISIDIKHIAKIVVTSNKVLKVTLAMSS